jgi:hypothetical protein
MMVLTSYQSDGTLMLLTFFSLWKEERKSSWGPVAAVRNPHHALGPLIHLSGP